MVSDDSSSDGLAALGLPADNATSPGGRQGRGQDRGPVPAKRNLKSRLNPSDLIFRAIARGGGSVALMITPIITSDRREAFSQAPVSEREGAYALGATRWGMIRAVVRPFGTGAMVGGTMLGLGRALGETMAVTLILSFVPAIQLHILQQGSSSISSLIALKWPEATPFGVSALMAAGLALFALTLVVNYLAAIIVSRSRSGAASEA